MIPATHRRVSVSMMTLIRPRRAPRRRARRPRPSSPRCAGSVDPPRPAGARPSAPLVPSRRTTNGTSGLRCGERLDQPAGDLVAPRDPAEDVEEDGPDPLIGEDHLDRRGDRLGLGPAAGVEEVGRRAAVEGDEVERRHHEAGAVAEDPDVAVELDVGQTRGPAPSAPAGRRRPCRAGRRCPGGGTGRCRRALPSRRARPAPARRRRRGCPA